MNKLWILSMGLMLSACSTEYILMDENHNPVDEGYYTENVIDDEFYVAEEDMIENSPEISEVDNAEVYAQNESLSGERNITANDVFVVGEGADYVTYQYKNVRVDEISPLASLYCADVTSDGSPYLREVNLYHNGFMRATFDCVSLAI